MTAPGAGLIGTLVLAGVLLASPALAGACFPQAGGLRCVDGQETLILQGPVVQTIKPGERVILQSDGQGGTFGMIGDQRLMLIRAGGMSAAKLGERRLICVEAAPGTTMCK